MMISTTSAAGVKWWWLLSLSRTRTPTRTCNFVRQLNFLHKLTFYDCGLITNQLKVCPLLLSFIQDA